MSASDDIGYKGGSFDPHLTEQHLPVMRLAAKGTKFVPYNGITSTSEATGYELDGAGLAIIGRLCNSIKIWEAKKSE